MQKQGGIALKLMTCIGSLVSYAMNCGLAEPEDHQVLINRLLELMGEMEYIPSDEPQCEDLEDILAGLLDYAVEKGICDNNILAKDLFDATHAPGSDPDISGKVCPQSQGSYRLVLSVFR